MTLPRMIGLIAAVSLAWTGASLLAQTRPAPLYSLPPDGTWVEYAWHGTVADNKKQAGTLRISSVGKKNVALLPHRWIEIKIELEQGSPRTVKIRKVLVAENALAPGNVLKGNIAEAYAQIVPAGAVQRLAQAEFESFLRMGFEANEDVFKEKGLKEDVETGLGKVAARHVSVQGKAGPRLLEYEGWLTSEIPFGWAKCQVVELPVKAGAGPVFAAHALRSGEGARSELDETKVK